LCSGRKKKERKRRETREVDDRATRERER